MGDRVKILGGKLQRFGKNGDMMVVRAFNRNIAIFNNQVEKVEYFTGPRFKRPFNWKIFEQTFSGNTKYQYDNNRAGKQGYPSVYVKLYMKQSNIAKILQKANAYYTNK